jgi:hypothetical protein
VALTGERFRGAWHGRVRASCMERWRGVASSRAFGQMPSAGTEGGFGFVFNKPDQHNVKCLAGGRVHYIDHRPAAALVYKRRQHSNNLFAWPSGSPVAALEAASEFSLVVWNKAGVKQTTALGSHTSRIKRTKLFSLAWAVRPFPVCFERARILTAGCAGCSANNGKVSGSATEDPPVRCGCLTERVRPRT